MRSLHQLFDMSNRTVLITGGMGHLGSVFASSIAELGGNLILVDRDAAFDNSQHANFSLHKDYGVQVDFRPCDLESENQRGALVLEVQQSFKSIHGLINNAAFTGSSQLEGWVCDFESQSLDSFRRALEVNTTAVFHLCQGLAATLRRTKGASIVNISSIYGSLGPYWDLYDSIPEMGNPAAYGCSKSALNQMTRWLSTTLAPEVRVNAIAPGGLERGQAESFLAKYENKTPLHRMGTVEDFKGIIAFLCSDASSYLTGQVITVDGGFSAQ